MNTAMIKAKMIQHGPEIMLWSGAGMVVAGVVTTVFTTLRQQKLYSAHKKNQAELEDKLQDANEKLIEAKKLIKKQKEIGAEITVDLKQVETDMDYVSTEVVKENKRETLHYIFKSALNIAIPAGLTALGLFCMIKGHYILKGRLALTAAALAATKSAFEAYRNRVRNDVGEDKDYEYMHGVKKGEVEIEDPETGEKETVEADIISDNDLSEFGDVFDSETSTEYEPHMDYNISWINQVNMTMNDQFKIGKGPIFLNDVRKALGMKPLIPTKEHPDVPNGQMICWYPGKNDAINITYKLVYRKNEQGRTEQVLLIDFDPYGDIRSIV